MAALPRFHVPELAGQSLIPDQVVPLPESVQHHAHRVLRLAQGESVVLFDGAGRQWAGTLDGRHCAHCRVTGPLPGEAQPALACTLVQGISSNERMDWCIEKAVELGVHRIVPVQCHKGAVRLSGERAQQRAVRWQRIIAAACAQSGRSRMPALDDVAPLTDWLGHSAALPRPGGPMLRLVLDPSADASLADRLGAGSMDTPGSSISILCGPESGLAPGELAAAQSAGWLPVRLGPWVLRTETAGPAALAAIQALAGNWRHRPAPDQAAAGAGAATE